MDPRLRKAYSRCIVEVIRGLLLDLVNGFYDYLMVDLASITYGLKDPRAFLMNVRLAVDYDYLKPSVVFVVDYSRPEHRAVTESRVKWLRELSLDFMCAWQTGGYYPSLGPGSSSGYYVGIITNLVEKGGSRGGTHVYYNSTYYYAGLVSDGSFDTIRIRNHVYPRIRLTTSEKYRWEPILKSIKIKYYEDPYKNSIINITFCCSRAAELMQRIKGIFARKAPILLRLLDILVNETKIERARHIMNMEEVRSKGEFSVELLGYLFHVNISNDWSIMFMKRMSDVERAYAIATEVAQHYGLSNDDIKVYPESYVIIIKPSGTLIIKDENDEK